MVIWELFAGRELDGFCGMCCRSAGGSIAILPVMRLDRGKLNVSRLSVVFFQHLRWPSPLTGEKVRALLQLSFPELIQRAASLHRRKGREDDVGREGARRQ